MFGAAIGSCEQRIFPIQRDGTDRTFDGVVVEFDTAIVDEARQALPARESVADGLGEFALLQTSSHPSSHMNAVTTSPMLDMLPSKYERL